MEVFLWIILIYAFINFGIALIGTITVVIGFIMCILSINFTIFGKFVWQIFILGINMSMTYMAIKYIFMLIA